MHHSDHGSQYVSIVYNNKLTDLGIKASTRTVGDSYNNALAKTVNGLYKTELIYSTRGSGSPWPKLNWRPRRGCTGETPSASTKP